MKNNLQQGNSNELSIRDFRLLVHLGNSPEERLNPQQVSVDITFTFDSGPIAAKSDDIADTICYSIVTELIQNFIATKSFNLIEHLAASIYTILYQYLTEENECNNISIGVVVTKLSVPVLGMYGGASFSYYGPPIS